MFDIITRSWIGWPRKKKQQQMYHLLLFSVCIIFIVYPLFYMQYNKSFMSLCT